MSFKSSLAQVIAGRGQVHNVCPCCADLDMQDPTQWMRGTTTSKDGFEHRFCTRTVKSRDLGYYTEMGCPICAAFYEAIGDFGGEEICLRLFFGEGSEFFSDDGENSSGTGLPYQNLDWDQLYGTIDEEELCSLFAGLHTPAQLLDPRQKGSGPGQQRAAQEMPEIRPTVRSHTVLSFVMGNLQSCLREHALCQQPTSTLPRRVIEVGTIESPTIRLFEPNPDTTGSYVALSYCWGNRNLVTTTTSTIEQLKSGIEVAKLPKTLQDAVVFTRNLAIEFLWIDALCIIQDSAADWEVESAKMGDIYSQAFLTVAAASATSAAEGFLQGKDPEPEFQLKWPDGSMARATVDRTGSSGTSDDEPWNLRGWTFQEQILSKRLVIYSDGEVQWVCRSSHSCECGSVDQFAHDRSGTTIWELADAAEAHAFWVNVVSAYSARSLTVEMDRLPALSGIASRIGRLTASPYLAGLWVDNVLPGLCWYRSTPADCWQSATYRAPTFSWASVDGPTFCYSRDKSQDAKEPNLMPHCIDTDATVNGQNPFGAVVDAWIKLRAPLITCTLQGIGVVPNGWTDIAAYFNPDTELRRFSYQDCDGKAQTSAARQSSLKTIQGHEFEGDITNNLPHNPEGSLPAWLLYIGSRNYDVPQVDPTRVFLVLGRSPRDLEMYERLGLLVVSPVFPISIPEDSVETVIIT
ncbi:Fc.00g033720.m01.CDS01 [Cosmosporella sp. VM-42]